MVTEPGKKDDRYDVIHSECMFYLDLMSHEVLNFNQAVLGYLELTQNNQSINEDIKHYLLSAISQIKNSSQLIDDVKKIAHLGMINESMFEMYDLKKVAEDEIEELKFLYPERKIKIDLKSVSDRVFVKASEALRDIFLQLITNAVKFDTSDEVLIDVTISRAESAPGMIDISVEDRGSGIPDQLKEVLTAEMESDEKTKRVRGMGLLLVRAAAKRFGGMLIVSDRVPGDHTKGAKMTVRLPEVQAR